MKWTDFYKTYDEEFSNLKRLNEDEFDKMVAKIEHELMSNPTYNAYSPLLIYMTDNVKTFIYKEDLRFEDTFIFGFDVDESLRKEVKLKSVFIGKYPKLANTEDTQTFESVLEALHFLRRL